MSISMLDEKLPILIRETLHDTGSKKFSNASPDIIVRKSKYEENKLDTIFTKTYDQDISLDRDGSEKMYLYVRFKNTSNKPLENFYIHLYRNHLGLINRPGDWEKSEMHTEAGTPVHIGCLDAGKIGATPAFVYDKKTEGAHPNCFVAVATRERTPDYSSVNSYDKYIQWVNKPNVAARNVCMISAQSGIYTATVYANSQDAKRERWMLLRVRMEEGTPSGVNYGVRQKTFDIDEKRTYIEGDSSTNSITCEFLMPPGAQCPFEIWIEASQKDLSHVKYNCRLYLEAEFIYGAVFDQYLVDLNTGLALPNDVERLTETSGCGYLLGCCYFKGIEAR